MSFPSIQTFWALRGAVIEGLSSGLTEGLDRSPLGLQEWAERLIALVFQRYEPVLQESFLEDRAGERASERAGGQERKRAGVSRHKRA